MHKFNINKFETKRTGANTNSAYGIISNAQWRNNELYSSMMIFNSKADSARKNLDGLDIAETIDAIEIRDSSYSHSALVADAANSFRTLDARFALMINDNTDNNFFRVPNYTCKNGIRINNAYCWMHSISVVPNVLSATLFVYNSKRSYSSGNQPDEIVNVHNNNYNSDALFATVATIFKNKEPKLTNMQADLTD